MTITPIDQEEVRRWRADTPGTSHVVHFNNAGASLPTVSVLNAIKGYLEKESLAGGYEVEALYHPEIDRAYDLVAQLIGAEADEIALVENASTAWCIAFHGIDFRPGDEVLISEFEYVTNMIGYLYGRKKYGIILKVIANDENGNFSISNLEKAITSHTKLIAVTHIASGTGGILPVERIGEIAAKFNILYLVDACQSIGHLPVDVQKIRCDFLSATGRKYLRAPRGTGFLYVRKNVQDTLQPLFIDGHATTIVNEDDYRLRDDARRFQLFEKNHALTLGLAKAVDYALQVGVARIWQRIEYLANYLRTELRKINGIAIQDSGDRLSGIVTFTVEGIDSQQVKEFLAENRINVSVGVAQSTMLYMNKHHLMDVVRASVHYYNIEKEIDNLSETLFRLVRQKNQYAEA